MPRYRLGCTGWGYDDWQGGFYPRGTPASDYLRRYAKVFDLVEVDSSYYAAPRREQIARWVEATPPGFTFTLKFPGDITHKAHLQHVDEKVEAFLVSLAPLRAAGKLGPLVLQLPASFRRDKHEAALHAFLAAWPRDVALAVELRDPSWWAAATYRALESAGAALVWSYSEYGRAPPVTTADWGYMRLIGDRALDKFDRIQRDHTPEMRYWKEHLENEGRVSREWYIFVNNHLMGFAPGTAARMAEVLGMPAPDLAKAMRSEGQASLF